MRRNESRVTCNDLPCDTQHMDSTNGLAVADTEDIWVLEQGWGAAQKKDHLLHKWQNNCSNQDSRIVFHKTSLTVIEGARTETPDLA